MKQLTNLTLFSLLAEPIKGEDYQEKLEKAYVELIDETLHLHEVENDATSIIRKLNFARIELILLETNLSCEKGKKM